MNKTIVIMTAAALVTPTVAALAYKLGKKIGHNEVAGIVDRVINKDVSQNN